MMDIDLQAKDFEYLAEGSAHLVLSYVGPSSNTALFGRILRVGLSGAAESGHEEEVFARKVIIPLLGEEYVDAGLSVPCTEALLRELSDQVSVHRNEEQRVNHAVDFSMREVTLMRNFANYFGKESWCVEVKPKYCFPARSKLLPDSLRIKYEHPFYQILFNEDQRAGYLPTDFFSGDETRIHCALIALYRAHHKWLRIFQDGRLLDKNNEPEMGNELIHAAAHALEVEQRCLEKIEAMQRLEYIDSYGAKLIAEELRRRDGGIREKLRDRLWDVYRNPELYRDLPREVVAYEDATQAYLQYKSSTANDAREQVKAMSDHQLIGLLAEYMIAAVGKDLSVMVCLKKTDAGWKHVVGVVDIGAKGDEKIDKWYERDMNLVRQFRRRMESR